MKELIFLLTSPKLEYLTISCALAEKTYSAFLMALLKLLRRVSDSCFGMGTSYVDIWKKGLSV
jgi:hypothetical protein